MSCTYIFPQSLLILEHIFILKRQCRCSFRLWLKDSLFVRALPSFSAINVSLFLRFSRGFGVGAVLIWATGPINVKYLILQRWKRRKKKCACSDCKCNLHPWAYKLLEIKLTAQFLSNIFAIMRKFN